MADVIERGTAQALTDWLVGQALPTWAKTGVDWAAGGFVEAIDRHGIAVEAPRRARVVARQIYVFATAARRRWLPEADAAVDHGLRFLLGRMQQPDGTFAAAVRADGGVVDGGFDLYEHAFVLFALAAACRGRPDRDALRATALALLQRLREGWAHPLAGFEEAVPRRLPLKSNPHMHLLEAALAWAAISEGSAQREWQALADDITGLCLARFIDSGDGSVREHFDGDWRPTPGPRGRVVEPGHQFEWAWLLMRWAAGAQRPEALRAARRLCEIGERHGVDALRGIAVNELGKGWAVTDGAAKLWPQTERIKAWHAMQAAGDPHQAAFATEALTAAVRGLGAYLLPRPAGLWQEVMAADGSFVPQHCKASSLYHIVCAIDTLQEGGAA